MAIATSAIGMAMLPPMAASAIATRYIEAPTEYIQRLGRWRVAQGTIRPQSSDTMPARK